MQRQTVGVIGFGRFGQYWAATLASDHDVIVTDQVDGTARAEAIGARFTDLKTLTSEAQTIFLCVPINRFEALVRVISPLLRPGTVVIDTCSVKAHPAQVMLNALRPLPRVELICTHPMFGPDSGSGSLEGLPMVMWPLHTETTAYQNWRDYFAERGLHIVEMPPDEHDQLAANSQGITHYIGRILNEMHLSPSAIDTSGFRILLSLKEQTCNDSWELFQDLQQYNPYTREMRLRLEGAMERVYEALLPRHEGMLQIGIQGGQGSFNEEACRYYCGSHEVGPFNIHYLYTAVNVLNALHRGEVDRGVFAIQNARGGVVMETIHGLSRYQCEILDVFDIVISHCLMHHPDTPFEEIDTIISHPQALAQCKGNLDRKYPGIRRISGEGDLIDQAFCAQNIAEGNLPRTTAVLASGVCAELYGLRVQDTNLQDMGKDNLTTFVWVRRRNYFR